MEALRNWANSSIIGVSQSGWSSEREASSSEEPSPMGVAFEEFEVCVLLESSSCSVSMMDGGVMKSRLPKDWLWLDEEPSVEQVPLRRLVSLACIAPLRCLLTLLGAF